jgi:hypothetical protein
MPNFWDIQLPKKTRSNDGECRVARFKGHTKTENGRGHIRQNITEIDVNSTKLFTEKAVTSKTLPLSLCKICLQEIGKGKQHSCSTTNVSQNIAKLVVSQSIPEKQQEQTVTSIIKNKLSFKSMPDCNSRTKINLSTRGRKSTIVVNPKKINDKTIFSHERLDNLKVNIGASSRQMSKLTNLLRSCGGRNVIPANYKQYSGKRATTFEQNFALGS